MRDPTFTVVMAAYNAERTIAASIRSVLGQTRSDLELIVVDDGSTDATADRVRAFGSEPRIRFLAQPNAGPAAARNAALAQARGRYVSLLDADDLYLPGYLDAMAKALEDNRQAGISYASTWVLDTEVERIRRVPTAMPSAPPTDPEELFERLLVRNFIPSAATMRRVVFDRVGSFNPTLPTASDFEFWLRIVAHGFGAAFVGNRLSVYRVSRSSLSADPRLSLTGLREVYRLVAEEYDISEQLKAHAREYMRNVDRSLAMLNSPGPHAVLHRGAKRARQALGSFKRHLFAERIWYRAPPPEVAALLSDS